MLPELKRKRIIFYTLLITKTNALPFICIKFNSICLCDQQKI